MCEHRGRVPSVGDRVNTSRARTVPDASLKFPRRLIRKLETPDLPLEALESIRRLRRYLDELEAASLEETEEIPDLATAPAAKQ
jgi:hypothetical protein